MRNTTYNSLCLFIILLLLMINSNCASSESKMTKNHSHLESMIKSGKETIVKIAQDIIQVDTGENVPNTYVTKVFANDSSLIVFFDMPIKFVRENSAFYYGASIDLISKTKTYMPLINTEDKIDPSKHFPFFQPSTSDIQWVEFILNADSKEPSSFRRYWKALTEDQKTLTIIEQNTLFDIKVLSPSESIRFKVDKKTGAISDSSHRHIKTQSLIEQGYSEIKK